MDKKLNIIQNYFPDKRNGLVVECGTAEGHHQPSMYLEKMLNWQFIGFEPDPRYHEVLAKNRPDSLRLEYALSDQNGIAQFEISAWGGNSSLEHSVDHRRELISYNKTFNDGQFFHTIFVTTITWAQFIKMYKIKHVDFLILDVEGSELRVIKGMQGCEVLPDVMQVEFAYSDHQNSIINKTTRENFSGFKIIKDDLEPLGYQFDYLSENNLIFSKNTFWQDREKPKLWFGEDKSFSWNGYCMYDKEKCKNL